MVLDRTTKVNPLDQTFLGDLTFIAEVEGILKDNSYEKDQLTRLTKLARSMGSTYHPTTEKLLQEVVAPAQTLGLVGDTWYQACLAVALRLGEIEPPATRIEFVTKVLNELLALNISLPRAMFQSLRTDGCAGGAFVSTRLWSNLEHFWGPLVNALRAIDQGHYVSLDLRNILNVNDVNMAIAVVTHGLKNSLWQDKVTLTLPLEILEQANQLKLGRHDIVIHSDRDANAKDLGKIYNASHLFPMTGDWHYAPNVAETVSVGAISAEMCGGYTLGMTVHGGVYYDNAMAFHARCRTLCKALNHHTTLLGLLSMPGMCQQITANRNIAIALLGQAADEEHLYPARATDMFRAALKQSILQGQREQGRTHTASSSRWRENPVAKGLDLPPDLLRRLQKGELPLNRNLTSQAAYDQLIDYGVPNDLGRSVTAKQSCTLRSCTLGDREEFADPGASRLPTVYKL